MQILSVVKQRGVLTDIKCSLTLGEAAEDGGVGRRQKLVLVLNWELRLYPPGHGEP